MRLVVDFIIVPLSHCQDDDVTLKLVFLCLFIFERCNTIENIIIAYYSFKCEPATVKLNVTHHKTNEYVYFENSTLSFQ